MIGRVGSGKTALALSILGEIHQSDPGATRGFTTLQYCLTALSMLYRVQIHSVELWSAVCAVFDGNFAFIAT